MRLPFAMMLLLAAPLAQATPEIQHWQTANGARVYFIETHDLPMVDISMVFDAASAREPAGLQGLAMLTNDMLLEGTAELDGLAIAEGFEKHGAEVETSSARDMATIGLRSLSAPGYLDPVTELLASIVAAPTFPTESLEREKARALHAVEVDLQEPDSVAQRRFYEIVYAGHPYANDPLGTAEGIAAVDRADTEDFHRRYYVASNLVLALVGDLDRPAAEALAERLTRRLPRGEPAPGLPSVPRVEGQVVRIEFPSTQTHIRMGQAAISRDDLRNYALRAGNHALGGGGFQSRLLHEIREKRGYSYGAYSYFLPMHQEGPFIVGLQTKNAQVDDAVAVTNAVVDGFLAAGPTAAELDMAKKHITGGFPMTIDSNKEMVSILASIGFYGLPLDYLATYIDRINSIGHAEILDAFNATLSRDGMVTVIVGGGA